MKLRRRQSADDPGQLSLDTAVRLLYHALRQRIWLMLICTVIAVGGACLYLTKAPRVYQAHTIVQVQAQEKNPLNLRDTPGTGDLDKLESLKTIEFNLARRELLRRVVAELKLTANDVDLPPTQEWTEADITDALAGAIAVNLLRGTRLIGITVQNTRPERAAELANTLVAEYGRALFEERSSSSMEANSFLVRESERLKAKLEASEQALQQYKEQSNAVSLEQSQNIIVAQLKELNGKLTDARGERLKLESASARLNEEGSVPLDQLLAISQIANAPQVVEQQRQLAAMQAEVARLEGRYLELHPKLIQAKGQLTQTRENLRLAATEAAKSLVALAEAARETEAKYESALVEQEKKALDLNRLSIRYNVLAREVAADTAMFDSVMKRLQETDITKFVDPEIIQVVGPAAVPRIPVKPRKKLILGGALAAGLLLGALVALGLWALDSSFRTVDEVETQLGVPVLTTVSLLQGTRSRNRSKWRRKITEASRQPAVAESFRTLRTALALQEPATRTYLITSSIPGEGKSFSAANHALALARGGASTLLIDADLRLPVIEQLFSPTKKPAPGGSSGLAEVLDGSAKLQEVVQTTEVPHLFILSSGRLRADPGQLFLSPALPALLEAARAAYEYIVIDSAPIHAVADTLILARQPVSVCLVVMSGLAPRKTVSRALQMLVDSGARVAGVILNGVPENGEYYYHYRTSLSDAPLERAEAAVPSGKPIS
jgi:succinoglycan biosynthesis transport protein ExoP